MQQLMTGVYISEVCLIGLFAINTAPGPIVLMAIFLGFTAFYHFLIMRPALKQLITYLPDSFDGDGQLAMFTTTDTKSYDSTKAGAPPSEAAPLQPTKLDSMTATLFGRIFNPQKFKSHQGVQDLVPKYPAPRYEEKEGKP